MVRMAASAPAGPHDRRQAGRWSDGQVEKSVVVAQAPPRGR